MSAEVTINFDDAKIRRAIEEATVDALNAGAVVLEDVMRTNFGSEGGGTRKQAFRLKKDASGKFITNRHGKPKRFRSNAKVHLPAPPGAFPNVQTGRLKNSITTEKAEVGKPYALVGTNIWYGRLLEFGGIFKSSKGKHKGNSISIPARPWCLRSLNMARDRIMAAAQRRFATSLASKLR